MKHPKQHTLSKAPLHYNWEWDVQSSLVQAYIVLDHHNALVVSTNDHLFAMQHAHVASIRQSQLWDPTELVQQGGD
jgi:hypothetical protein